MTARVDNFCWVTRCVGGCGAILAVCSGRRPEAVRDFLTDELDSGRDPERVSFEDIDADPNFMRCACGHGAEEGGGE